MENEERALSAQEVMRLSETDCEVKAMPDYLTCVAKCVNCNRTYETKPRTKNERTRNVLCAQCRRSYEGS